MRDIKLISQEKALRKLDRTGVDTITSILLLVLITYYHPHDIWSRIIFNKMFCEKLDKESEMR